MNQCNGYSGYSFVREIGGLVICDEVQTGLGRLGHHWWGFQVTSIALLDNCDCIFV